MKNLFVLDIFNDNSTIKVLNLPADANQKIKMTKIVTKVKRRAIF